MRIFNKRKIIKKRKQKYQLHNLFLGGYKQQFIHYCAMEKEQPAVMQTEH
jgi:hypothetical protein